MIMNSKSVENVRHCWSSRLSIKGIIYMWAEPDYLQTVAGILAPTHM